MTGRIGRRGAFGIGGPGDLSSTNGRAGCGLDVETSSPAVFAKRMTADLARFKAIIDETGYKPT